MTSSQASWVLLVLKHKRNMTVAQVFFASSNHGKVLEVRSILREVMPTLHVYSLQDFPDWSQQVEESGQTYHDNALLKARAYQDNPRHLPVIADDSGLEVAALPGLLGIHSQRWYQGKELTKAQALLQKLKGVQDRSMVFHTTFCYLAPSQPPQFFEGDLPGSAALELAGGDGFDYDPIFVPQGFKQTYAELGETTKNRISQRRAALESLAIYLQNSQ